MYQSVYQLCKSSPSRLEAQRAGLFIRTQPLHKIHILVTKASPTQVQSQPTQIQKRVVNLKSKAKRVRDKSHVQTDHQPLWIQPFSTFSLFVCSQRISIQGMLFCSAAIVAEEYEYATTVEISHTAKREFRGCRRWARYSFGFACEKREAIVSGYNQFDQHSKRRKD
jgi:hypothetical protein